MQANQVFVIRQVGLGISRLGDIAGLPLPTDRKFAIYDPARRELAPETAAKLAPPEMVKLLKALNASVGDVSGDEQQIGIADTKDHTTKTCNVAFARFKRWNVPTSLERGRYDLANGLSAAELIRPISVAAADRLAPALSAFLHKYYKTKSDPRIETPDEEAERLRQESVAKSDADNAAQVASAKIQRQTKRDAVIAEIELVLADGNPGSRAERLLRALENHYGLVGR